MNHSGLKINGFYYWIYKTFSFVRKFFIIFISYYVAFKDNKAVLRFQMWEMYGKGIKSTSVKVQLKC